MPDYILENLHREEAKFRTNIAKYITWLNNSINVIDNELEALKKKNVIVFDKSDRNALIQPYAEYVVEPVMETERLSIPLWVMPLKSNNIRVKVYCYFEIKSNIREIELSNTLYEKPFIRKEFTLERIEEGKKYELSQPIKLKNLIPTLGMNL